MYWQTKRGKKYLYKITINVPLFKKLRDIIFFLRDNHFMSHFKGHFEGAKTFLTPEKVEAPSKCPEKKKLCPKVS
jgi:hypothetical protein